MAVGHIAIRVHSRSQGHTAAAALAYRHGETVRCARTGAEHNYTKRRGVVSQGVASDSSCKLNDLGTIAAAMEGAERRRNSRLLRDVQVALPCELDTDERTRLTSDFAEELAVRYGTVCPWAVHLPDRKGDARNHHAHIVLPTRKLNAAGDGFGNKLRILDDATTGPEEITSLRELWQTIANRALEREGLEAKVDVGRTAFPQPTLGSACTAIERKEHYEGDPDGSASRDTTGMSVARIVTAFEPRTSPGEELARHVSFVQERGASPVLEDRPSPTEEEPAVSEPVPPLPAKRLQEPQLRLAPVVRDARFEFRWLSGVLRKRLETITEAVADRFLVSDDRVTQPDIERRFLEDVWWSIAPKHPAALLYDELDRITQQHYGGPSPSDYRASWLKLLRGKPPVGRVLDAWAKTRPALLTRIVAVCLPAVASFWRNAACNRDTRRLAALLEFLPLLRRSRLRKKHPPPRPEPRIFADHRPDPLHLQRLRDDLAAALKSEEESEKNFRRYRRKGGGLG